MMSVHRSGLGVAGVYTHDVAETKVKTDDADRRGSTKFPLLVTMEPGTETHEQDTRSVCPETLETIQRAFRRPPSRRHDTVGLEHLLLADHRRAARAAQLAGAAPTSPSLRQQRDRRARRAFAPVPGSGAVEPEPTVASTG